MFVVCFLLFAYLPIKLSGVRGWGLPKVGTGALSGGLGPLVRGWGPQLGKTNKQKHDCLLFFICRVFFVCFFLHTIFIKVSENIP